MRGTVGTNAPNVFYKYASGWQYSSEDAVKGIELHYDCLSKQASLQQDERVIVEIKDASFLGSCKDDTYFYMETHGDDAEWKTDTTAPSIQEQLEIVQKELEQCKAANKKMGWIL